MPKLSTARTPNTNEVIPLVVPISVTALRAVAYSPDRKNVIISLETKYSSAERRYSVPPECFHDLIVNLQRLNAWTDTIETSISQ